MLILGVFPPKIGDCFPPNMGWVFQIMDFPLLILMDDLGKIHYLKETPNSTQGIKLKKGYTPED